MPSIRHLVGLPLVLLCLPAATRSQTLCDPGLDQDSGRPSGYQPRTSSGAPGPATTADHCEGIHAIKVNSLSLQLVGLIAAPTLGDLCLPGQSVHLVWPQPGGAEDRPVRLRLTSLRQDSGYRLDMTPPADSSYVQWPRVPRCNSDVRLRAAELGALVTTSFSQGGDTFDVLLPVGIAEDPRSRPAPPYRVVIVPGRRVAEVFVSLTHYRDDQTAARVFFERPLRRPPYLANGRIAIDLLADDLKLAGLYGLTVSVEFEGAARERAVVQRRFLHVP